MDVDVIDLQPLWEGNEQPVVDAVREAAMTSGFFQVINHNISPDLIAQVWDHTHDFFAQPMESKRQLLRTKDISRGYYDRELTKNKRDKKEVFDFATVPHPDRPHDHASNFAPVDGHNQWPSTPHFQSTMMEYLGACEELALELLGVFAVGMNQDAQALHRHFGPHNTSFIRLNHYPTNDLLTSTEAQGVTSLGDMALHHHTDSGAFTLLLQDDEGGLQAGYEGRWIDVPPTAGALVVNTGDMLQVWSNDRYQAALHRVRPMTGNARFSLPYFFNPSYDTNYAPLPRQPEEQPLYRPINWGDFRQARADGDFADYGTEVQISQYRRS